MSQSTGTALLPAVEASLAAFGLDDEYRDLAAEATALAKSIDEAASPGIGLHRHGSRLIKVLGALRAASGRVGRMCVICSRPIPAKRPLTSTTCGGACSAAYRKARTRNREHLRRAAVSDITPEQEDAMRRKARKCPMPGCGVRLTDKLNLPNSKHLDHIIPVCVGGTHTHGNVRIICADCNLKRPKDGSDYTGQVTLWAQGESPVKRPRKKYTINRATCRSGLHPWIPENIEIRPGGKRRCKACAAKRDRSNRPSQAKRPNLVCKCGTGYVAPGNTLMCPECTNAAALKAAELHQAGMTWDQVAAAIGYGSGEGARFAAKRIGYTPPRPAAKAKVRPHATCTCGASAYRHGRCRDCMGRAAARAVALRKQGWTLQMIADDLGYGSITSVTNLMKTLVDIEPRMGRPVNRTQ